MEIHNIRWIAVAILGLFLTYALVQAFNPKSHFNAALRNSGTGSKYSLTKAQLFWWTVLIAICLSISYVTTGKIEGVLNTSCLLLLGISLGTTAAGKIIDNSEDANPEIVRHQITGRKHNFWMDILSDHNGVNLHRFQSVIFNLLFGAIFIIQFFENDMSKLPAFDNTTLGLIGLSSGGFVALKFNENLSKRAARKVTSLGKESAHTT